LAIAASIGSGIVMALVLLVARHIQSSMTLLILGVLFGYLVNALVSLLLFFSIAERIQAYINWTYGSFNGVTWSQLKVMGPAIIVGLMIALLLSKPLNALLLGENYARSMGLNIHRARLWIVASTAILAGTVTAFAGPITFIGVAVPHLCRSLFGTSDHRILIPSTIIVGAIVALLAALIAELPGNRIVLPLNAITAFIGAPIVIWVILRRRNLRNTFAG
jgi:iron complex transport system permease protein